MLTQVLKIDENSLRKAKQLLNGEELVAFPTETVYGLGALATSDCAVKKIYEAKGRPSDNPLIVHVHKDYDVTKLVEITNDYSLKMSAAFLPGPLTMVYKSRGTVSKIVSCGLDTLAVRVPQNSDAQKFLRYCDLPIAAPSANISKHTSPVTAEHVFGDFNGKIPLILDGGRSSGGIESTVADVTGEYPVILRKGLVTAEMIRAVVGKCEYADENTVGKVRSPGMKYRHYCPNCETVLFNRDEIDAAIVLYKENAKKGRRVWFLADDELCSRLRGYNVLNLGAVDKEMAANLYELLHEGESKADLLISFRLKTDTELMLSVNNRFSKAFFKEKS